MKEYKSVKKRLADGSVRTYHYDKITGKPISGEPGTPAFARALEALRLERGIGRFPQGSLGSLMQQYRDSHEWKSLAPASRDIYTRGLSLLSGFEAEPVVNLRKSHVAAIRDKLSATPGAANNFLAALGAVLSWGVQSDRDEWAHLEYNVARAVKRLDMGSWERWAENDVLAFEKAETIPRDVRMGFMLLLYTGQRRGDVLKMTWGDFNAADFNGYGSIRVVQQKTAKGDDDVLWVPVHPNLRAVLDAERARAKGIYIVHRADGRPYTGPTDEAKKLQGNKFYHRLQAEQQRIFGGRFWPLHGLRKSAASRLAEAGCSVHEIMAITGHKSIKEVQRYTMQVERRKNAEAAMRRLAGDNVVPIKREA